MLFFQPKIHIFPEEGVEYRHQWDEDEHSYDSQEVSADGDCSENPDGGKTYGAADYVWVDQVTFNLLEDQEYKDKKDCLFRAHHKDQEAAECAADEGSEDRDQGCKGDNDSDQQGVRHFQYT